MTNGQRAKSDIESEIEFGLNVVSYTQSELNFLFALSTQLLIVMGGKFEPKNRLMCYNLLFQYFKSRLWVLFLDVKPQNNLPTVRNRSNSYDLSD